MSSLSELGGSYKLSKYVLNRLISQETGSESILSCVSGYEINFIIYLSHICDESGVVEELKISELSTILHCSVRTTYNIINNLVNKQFITISKGTWTGYRRVVLLNNDYSNVSDYKTMPYLNTNFLYFNHFDVNYSSFCKLSLYAKKSLLFILYNYQYNYGYRFSIDNIKDVLKIKDRLKIISYINELKDIFGESFCVIYGSKHDRLRYHNVYVQSKNVALIHNEGIVEKQDCYFKYKINILLRKEGIQSDFCYYNKNDLDPVEIKYANIHSIYTLTVKYLKQEVSLDVILSCIFTILRINGSLDELSLMRISKELETLVPAARCG